jgi:hypothetical protein
MPEACLIGEHLKGASRVKVVALLKNITLEWKGLPGKHSNLFGLFVNDQFFYNIGPDPKMK